MYMATKGLFVSLAASCLASKPVGDVEMYFWHNPDIDDVLHTLGSLPLWLACRSISWLQISKSLPWTKSYYYDWHFHMCTVAFVTICKIAIHNDLGANVARWRAAMGSSTQALCSQPSSPQNIPKQKAFPNWRAVCHEVFLMALHHSQPCRVALHHCAFRLQWSCMLLHQCMPMSMHASTHALLHSQDNNLAGL